MPDEDSNYATILDEIRDLRRHTNKDKKDWWDKLAIVAQILSGVVLVVIGFLVTARLDESQKESAKSISDSQIQSSTAIANEQIASGQLLQKTQENFESISSSNTLDTTNRTIVGEYFNNLMNASPEKRAAYIDALDVELGPKYSVPLAVRFSKPTQIRSLICVQNDGRIATIPDMGALEDEDNKLRRTTSDLMERLAKNPEARAALEVISKSKTQPDAGIADAYLGRRSIVQYRITEVDDFADVILNGKTLAKYKGGDSTPWIDMTKNMIPGIVNKFALNIGNLYEAAGARLEMRIGSYQYDKFVRTRDFEPAGPTFEIQLSIPVNSKGEARFDGDDIGPRTNEES